VSKNEQYVTGSSNIQVGGDLHITVHNGVPLPLLVPETKMLSREQRRYISTLVAEVENAEQRVVSARLIRHSMNQELNVASIEEVSDDMYRKATMYLTGWKTCALGEHQGESAMVSQVLRIWTICPKEQPVISKFTRDHFGTSKMNDLNYWQMRCVLSFAMHLWSENWKGKAI